MISKKIFTSLNHSSWIRNMFEEGERLRKLYGADNVYDFTLGNPDPEPPKEVKNSLRDIILSDQPGIHKYMNNAGFEDVREKIAQNISQNTNLSVKSSHIIMTCGAAGGLNVALKTILDEGDEVIVLAPYFSEYLFYIDNHGGVPVIASTNKDTFEPDLTALENCLNPKVKAIILNSPNNPTGVIYSDKILKAMAKLIEQKEMEYGHVIFVLSDEPYNKLVYDNIKIPSILNIFKHSMIINSFSKSLALPGERIGYIAVNPVLPQNDLIISGLTFANRTLGFVNAPALFQKVIASSLDAETDISQYKKKRDVLFDFLTGLGFDCIKPRGAFYLFPKSPIPDDIEFIKAAAKHNVLLVPGTGFGQPGYFRMSYCVSIDTIKNSLPAIEAIAREFF
ncbi:pyridoxal phosphate-dependent aminotransferase [Xylanivirga thermophila]|uniref:pyridoxal phosphate-dependent aminotransferase n=1 Tax=Xylanivirga thermophila TaxID=2496273 RepID=UPI00101D3BAF|nr:pyridoxal phosphate-dependent aminotransferase [Xylanivirga thermophila]